MAKILIVDDSVTFRQMVAHVLTGDGHDVAEADCAEDALRKLAECSPDMVLTDLYMPGIDGIGLAQKIREMRDLKTIPILVLSTDNSQEIKQRGRASGVTGWLGKPFDPDILQSVVSKVLS